VEAHQRPVVEDTVLDLRQGDVPAKADERTQFDAVIAVVDSVDRAVRVSDASGLVA